MFHEILIELAERLENSKYVDDYLYKFKVNQTTDDLATIANGFPSIALFYSQLNLIEPNQKFKKLLHHYLEKSISGFQNNIVNTSMSFFSGITGLCFVVWTSSENGKHYQGLLEKIDSILFNILDSKLKLFEEKKLFIPYDYDVIQGLSGVIRYLILRKNNEIHDTYLKKCLKILIKISAFIQYKNHVIPGWYLSKDENAFGFDNFKDSFNLGLSHGVSGILSALSISKINNIEVDEIENSIFTIKNWILKWTMNDKYGQYWPNKVNLEEEINGKYISSQHSVQRQAWCYGTPGISRTLYLAGTALNDTDLQNLSIKVFLEIENRPENEWYCHSPTFCHGYSGLLQIAKRFYIDSKNKELLKIIQKLERKVINFYSQSSPFLFKDLEHIGATMDDLKQIGIIEGAVGTALSLLDIEQFNNCVWDYPFLIN